MATRQLVPSLTPGVSFPAAFSSMATTFDAPQERISATDKNVPPLLASSLQQVEVMERLQQLMAWQERQKASLLRQQQEQIMQLHKQHQGSKHKTIQLESGEQLCPFIYTPSMELLA